MKCLKINNGKGEFSLDGTIYKSIDAIAKDDVLSLLETALDPAQELEMDTYIAEAFTNPAHKVIYENIYNKLESLKSNKAQFTSEISELYQEAYDKYKHQGTEQQEKAVEV